MNVIMTLGGGVLVHDVLHIALSADMPPCSIQNLHFSDSRVKHYLASYRFVATGKQETIKEEKVSTKT